MGVAALDESARVCIATLQRVRFARRCACLPSIWAATECDELDGGGREWPRVAAGGGRAR